MPKPYKKADPRLVGNSFAKKRGRPRTLIGDTEAVVALGEEYMAWLDENPRAVHHTEFYSIHKRLLDAEWDALTQCSDFTPYYQRARYIFAQRHMTGAVKDSIAHRFLRLYLGDLKKGEDGDKEFESKLRRGENREFVTNLEQLKQGLLDGDLTQK